MPVALEKYERGGGDKFIPLPDGHKYQACNMCGRIRLYGQRSRIFLCTTCDVTPEAVGRDGRERPAKGV